VEIEYDFVAAALVDQASYHDLAQSLKTDALRDVAMNFQSNLDRVVALALTPVQMVFLAGLAGAHTARARIAGGFQADDIAADADPAVIAESQRLADEQEYLATSEPLVYGSRIVSEMTDAYPRFLKTFPHLARGVEATLAAMTVDTWMSFEVLAGDLWRRTVNLYPQELAGNCIKAQPLRSADFDTSAQEKSIPLSIVERYQYDLGKSMGDVLAGTNKFKLDSLNGLLHAYKSAFGKDWDEQIVDRKGLHTIEAFRNLYAHRGGVIDDQFLQRVGKNLSLMLPPKPGQMFHMDGGNVKEMVRIVVSSGMSLINFVDRWAYERDHDTERDLPLDEPAPGA
jgi:hypothetical protein